MLFCCEVAFKKIPLRTKCVSHWASFTVSDSSALCDQAKALAEKTQRDLQSQNEQEEKHVSF